MVEKLVDSLVQQKLCSVGYTVEDIHYGYRLPSKGNKDFTPNINTKYYSKALKETSIEHEFLIFAGQGKKKYESLILFENKDIESNLGNQKNIGDNKNLYKLATTDGFFYAFDLLSKTKKIKSIFTIAVAGSNLKAVAIFLYKNTNYIDKYSKYSPVRYNDEISYIYIEEWNDWNEISKEKFGSYINENILNLSSPENEVNLTHIRSIAGRLSNTIDKKLKLDPFKRLLLVSGLLLGINEDENIINSFDKNYGAVDLYNRIDAALPTEKFSDDKKKQLLSSFSFIQEDKKITKEIINPKNNKNEGFPLSIISQELLVKSQVGYSIVDLMKQSSHIDLLGSLFDVFTKYMNVGGASGDIVLTPSHITKFMAEIIDVNPNDNVVDITVGTAGFLISAMHIMEKKVDADQTLTSDEKKIKKREIKENQLWGVEYDDNMYATAVTNMLLHGDGKSHIFHGDSLTKRDLTSDKTFDQMFEDVEFDKLLFNPPYDNQILFVKNGLDTLRENGLASIIIPKQTFNKGGDIVEDIFNRHTLISVFDLPSGQFKTKSGNKGTDVAIFVFKAHRTHNFEKDYVSFVKLNADEVGTKGNLKGIPSEKTERIYSRIVEFVESDYRDSKILENRKYFSEPVTTKLTKGKYMYRDYAPKTDITPTEIDFIETIGAHLEFLLSEKDKILEVEADEDI